MTRTLAITGLDKGMRSDDTSPGTLREAVDVLPWRGAIRRRGPITPHASLAQTRTLSAQSSGFSEQATTLPGVGLALASLPDGALGSSTFYGTEGTSLYSMGSAYGSRSFEADGEILVLPNRHVLTNTADLVKRWGGCITTLWNPSGITATVTAGSKVVTFSTAFTEGTHLAAGCYINVNPTSSTGNQSLRYYLVDKIVSTTKILLREPARVSYTGTDWQGARFADYFTLSDSASGSGLFGQANAGTFGASSNQNYGGGIAGCWHQGRLFFGNIQEAIGEGSSFDYQPFATRIRWSALRDEANAAGTFKGKNYFQSGARMDLGAGGGAITGMHSMNGSLVVLRKSSVDVITGGFSSSGVDLGASVNTVANGVGCKGVQAWRAFEDGIVFADENGCYLWDGEKVRNLTRGSIEIAWRNLFSASDAEHITVSCPGNRIFVQKQASPGQSTQGFVFDFGSGSWFRIQLGTPHSSVSEINGKYLAMRHHSGGTTVSSVDFRPVFEDLGSDDADRGLDPVGLYPSPYVLTNPIPLADGFQQGRVQELVLNDGGLMDAGCTYTARLLRGAIYSGDAFSGEADLAAMSLGGTIAVPEMSGTTVNQRSVRVRIDGSEDATHAMVEVAVAPGATTDTFAYALNAIGLVLEDNPNYQSA